MIVSKDEDLKLSMPHVGYILLKALQAEESHELTLLEAMKALKKAGVNHTRAISFGLHFLHALGAIEFSAPCIKLTANKEGLQ